MQILIILFTLGLLLLLSWRVVFVCALFSSWNYELRIYIELFKQNEEATKEGVMYLEEQYLKPYKHWYKLHKFLIHHFIKDSFLVLDIEKQIQEKYQG